MVGCARPKPSQGSVPVRLALASDFSFCFQCGVGSSLVLRRPIETTALTGQLTSTPNCPGTLRRPPQNPQQAGSQDEPALVRAEA